MNVSIECVTVSVDEFGRLIQERDTARHELEASQQALVRVTVERDQAQMDYAMALKDAGRRRATTDRLRRQRDEAEAQVLQLMNKLKVIRNGTK